jgi:hypothetical protein
MEDPVYQMCLRWSNAVIDVSAFTNYINWHASHERRSQSLVGFCWTDNGAVDSWNSSWHRPLPICVQAWLSVVHRAESSGVAVSQILAYIILSYAANRGRYEPTVVQKNLERQVGDETLQFAAFVNCVVLSKLIMYVTKSVQHLTLSTLSCTSTHTYSMSVCRRTCSRHGRSTMLRARWAVMSGRNSSLCNVQRVTCPWVSWGCVQWNTLCSPPVHVRSSRAVVWKLCVL